MRWQNLTIEAEESTALPGYREPAVIRHFDAPQALDTRFYEVRAKSALNRVPERSRMPFRWTINPYRGCSHACVYCLAGDTPVLMADGTQRAIRDLRPGDRIVGTERRGTHRRFTETEVLAHWSTVKRAYRTTLEDRTELVSSGDHRFLSPRGWKHVTRAADGADRRPRLTAGTELLALRVLAAAPARPTDDRPGSLGGMPGRLRVACVEDLGASLPLYDITTGTGDFVADGVVSHNCFARPTHKYLDLDPGRDFEKEIVVKVNAPEVLRAELARPSWKGEHVAMGTNTDPYQWVEGRYRLMPGIWEALRDARNPCSVLTKSPLLLRDLPIMQEIGQVTTIAANLSVPTIDEKAWRATEPHTPNPRARLEAVRALNDAGIPTGILIAPLMPGINDDPAQVERIVELATEAGATAIGGITLHLRGEVRGIFMDWLRSTRPDLVPRYEELYARGAYAPQGERHRVEGVLRRARARHDRPTRDDRRRVRDLRRVGETREQLARDPADERAATLAGASRADGDDARRRDDGPGLAPAQAAAPAPPPAPIRKEEPLQTALF